MIKEFHLSLASLMFLAAQAGAQNIADDSHMQELVLSWASQNGSHVVAQSEPADTPYIWFFISPQPPKINDVLKVESPFSKDMVYDYSTIECQFEILYIPMLSDTQIAVSEDDFTISAIMFDLLKNGTQMQISSTLGGYASKQILKVNYNQPEINLDPGRTVASNSPGYLWTPREQRYSSREEALTASLAECNTDDADSIRVQAPDSMGIFFVEGTDGSMNFRNHSRVTLMSGALTNDK